MTASDISHLLLCEFSNYDYKLCNTYVFGWESDFFAVSTSEYCIEVEIKVSKSDFKADFLKLTETNKNKHEYLRDKATSFKPNKFYFAFPHGLIDFNDIPLQYGIIECYPRNIIYNGYKIIRPAKFLHKEKLFDNKKFLKQLLNKFYYRYLNVKEKINLREYQLKFGQKTLF